MQYYYGEKNLYRALDEAEFWKHQEAEHAELILAITPNLEPNYAMALQQFQQELSETYEEAVKYSESVVRSKGVISSPLRMEMLQFIRHCLEQSQRFVALLQELLQKSQAVKANSTVQVVLHHLIRESQYFIGIDQLIL